MRKANTLIQYLIICLISACAVVIFAFIQYTIVEGQEFNTINFLIPVVVGLIFGSLLTRNMILSRKLKEERDTVMEKNKKIRLFTGTIVHDLKSPVSAINSLSELILDETDNLSEQNHEFIDLINKSSADILENITLILDKTKLEAGAMADHLEVGNPYFTIQSVIDKYIITALDKSISIQRELEKDLPEITYDKNSLDHILSNLISNAIKFSPPNTQVKIFNRLLSDRLKIIVEDEGLGMTDEDIANAFQEFKTLSARPTGNETSSGLGLSIVKQLVEQMGGDIKVRSKGKNKGSTFELTLKIAGLPESND